MSPLTRVVLGVGKGVLFREASSIQATGSYSVCVCMHVNSCVLMCACVCVKKLYAHLHDVSTAVLDNNMCPRIVQDGTRRSHGNHLQPQLCHADRVRVLVNEGVCSPGGVVGSWELYRGVLRHYGLKVGYGRLCILWSGSVNSAVTV